MFTDSITETENWNTIWSTKSKDNLFICFYEIIIERSDKQILLSFRFGSNHSRVFCNKKFEVINS